MKNETQLHDKLLESVAGLPLFYPHSGNDFLKPIELFAPFVKEFWFADLAYFGVNNPADTVAPVLMRQDGFELLDKVIRGPVAAKLEQRIDECTHKPYGFMEPCILTEIYRHLTSGQSISVHRRRGYGASALHKEINKLGVFFYRGDSSEGSNTPWLAVRKWHIPRKRKRWLMHTVLNKLTDGGLLVTDGSRCEGAHNPYKELRRFCCQDIGAESVQLAQSFGDDEERTFRCVGYAGRKNGPTLVWQVSKPEPTAA